MMMMMQPQSPKSNSKSNSRTPLYEGSFPSWFRNKSALIRASLIAILSIVAVSLLFAIFRTVYQEHAGKELKIAQHLEEELNFTSQRLLTCQGTARAKIENISSLISNVKDEIDAVRAQSKAILSDATVSANETVNLPAQTANASPNDDSKYSDDDIKSLEEELKLMDQEIARLKRENSKSRQDLSTLRKSYAGVKNAGEEGLNKEWPLRLPIKKKKRILGPPPEGYCLNPKDLNVSVPYKWFCYESANPLKMIGPDGKSLPLYFLGRFHHSVGERVYHFSVKTEGKYTLLDDNKEVASFFLNPEHCYCPETIEQFKKRYQCNPADEEALNSAFSRWELHSITEEVFENSRLRPEMYAELIRVSIINNTLHWKFVSEPADGEFFYWKEIKVFYASLLKKVKVPDVEFWHTHRNDGGVVHIAETLPPILAYGKNDLGGDIMVPTPHHTLWNRHGSPLIYATSGLPWEKRKTKAFFRGAHSGGFSEKPETLHFNPRFRLVIESKKRLNLTDALVTAKQGESYNGYIDKPTYEYMVKNNLTTSQKSPENALGEYKYVLNPDGNLASWRMSYQMSTGALILKQKSDNKEFWYDQLLEDGVNYLELAKCTQDLDQALDWVVSHDKEARQMASNAFHTWAQRMRPEDNYCWMVYLFEKLSQVLGFSPQVRQGMKNMDEEHPKTSCDCQNL